MDHFQKQEQVQTVVSDYASTLPRSISNERHDVDPVVAKMLMDLFS